MLEELFNLVKSAATDTVINNSDVPNEKNDDIVAEATNTVASGLRNVVAGGGAQNLLSLFEGHDGKGSRGGLLSNPIVNMMIGHLAEKLMSKYSLDGNQASNISGRLIPDVLSGLIHKSNDRGNDDFSLDNLLNSITGGKSSELVKQHQQGRRGGTLQDILQNITSWGGNGGLMDILGQMAGGARQQQQKNGGGGLFDIIKGFMR